MSNFYEERVLSVHHWTDTLFSFTTTRDTTFRFKNGQFTMIGIKVDEKPLLRAYSVVSTNYDENLEFFSIKVPDGPLTSRLQNLKVGDPIIVGKKATGTLVLDNLKDGKRPMSAMRRWCWCMAAGRWPSSPMASRSPSTCPMTSSSAR